MSRYCSHGDLFLCTRMQRTDADGDRFDVDMVIYFKVVSYSPGSPGCMYQRNGDPGWPPEAAEYEFEIDRIEFDSGQQTPNQPPDDAPWPLTDDEDALLRQWFDANYDQAWQAAEDGWVDERSEREDRAYDEWKDERLMDRPSFREAAE